MADGDVRRSQIEDTARAVKLVIVAALLVALVALAIDNRREVRLGWVVGDGRAPLWILVAASALAGALIGWLVSHRPRNS